METLLGCKECFNYSKAVIEPVFRFIGLHFGELGLGLGGKGQARQGIFAPELKLSLDITWCTDVGGLGGFAAFPSHGPVRP